MEFDIRKPLFVIAVIGAIAYYLVTHYTANDVLAYQHKNPDPTWGPMVDYYIGMGYFARSEYDPAVNAFNQLLTDYPTSQYTEDGLVKKGESYLGLKQWDNAKATYDDYIEKFPDGKLKTIVQRKQEYLRQR